MLNCELIQLNSFSLMFQKQQNNSLQSLLQIDMNHEEQARTRLMQQQRRKNVIQIALMRLKIKNQNYLKGLESNPKWRKIYNGLLFNNQQSQLSKLINLELCQANDKQDYGYFNPFQKIPISLCYNKINKKEIFQKQALYNLILLYDSRIIRQMNWNKVQQTTKSTIRALNISGICQKTDKNCFQNQIQKRVLQKERFKGKQFDFNAIYESGLADMAPISQTGHI